MDVLQLRRHLSIARRACNSTLLVNKEGPEHSSKLEVLSELLTDLLADPTRKMIIFSEWRTMLDRVEDRLDVFHCNYVRMDGMVPQKKRAAIVERFQCDPNCRVILMTNAGSMGLNLQSANTIINLDLPWNPAVLEQRIARAHRMGQKSPVHVYKLVTTDTIEERLLDVLACKQNLADAAIEKDSLVEAMEMMSGAEDMRRTLEQIAPLPAPVEENLERAVIAETRALQRRRVVSAGGAELVSTALALATDQVGQAPPRPEAVTRMTEKLAKYLIKGDDGHPKLVLDLPHTDSLQGIATALAQLLEPGTDES
jgi:superfamily II DNA/RNA helicase